MGLLIQSKNMSETIPIQYQANGYRTIYGDAELREAIAHIELLQKLGLSGGGGGGATSTEADPGSDATKALSVQGVTNGKPLSVSATSLPLPIGASTSSGQTTTNISLSSIDSKLSPITASITAIATDGTSGDKTIIIPTTGKALRISAICIQLPSLAAITIKKGAAAVSGAMSVTTAALEFNPPIGFNINETLVINIGSAVAVNGFATYWEV